MLFPQGKTYLSLLASWGILIGLSCSKEPEIVNVRHQQIAADFASDAVSGGNDSGGSSPGPETSDPPNTMHTPLLTVQSEGAFQSKLEWTLPPEAALGHGAKGYRLYREGAMLAEVGASIFSYEDAGLRARSSYTYEISSIYPGDHESPRSAPVSITTLALSGSDLYDSYCGDCHGELAFSTKRGATKERITIAISSVMIMQGLVDFLDAEKIAAIAGALSESPKDTTKPAAPSGLSAGFVGPMGVVLNWNAATDNPGGSGIDRYQLFRNGAFSVDIAGDITTLPVNGLNADTAYEFELLVIDNAGNSSSRSTPLNVKTLAAMATPDRTAPSVPNQLAGSALSPSSVRVSWAASTDEAGGSGLASYRVFRDGTFLRSVGAAQRELVDSGLTSGTTYSYSVQSEDFASNRSNLSTPMTVMTNSLNGAQLYAMHCQGCHQMPADARAANKTVAQIQRAIDTLAVMQSLKGLGAEVVAAIGMFLAPAPDLTPPTVPTNLATSAITAFSISLSWSPAADAGGSGLAGYTVFRNDTKVADVGSSSYTDSGLSPATPYVYKVRARDAAGNVSNFTANLSTSTVAGAADTTAPTVPLSLMGIPSGKMVKLSWQASTDTGGSGIASYRLYRGTTRIAEIASPSLTYTDSNLAAATSYSYSISAVDKAGLESSRSAAINVTTSASSGEELYATNCETCHQPLAQSTKKNRSAMTIRNAIAGQAAMKFLSFLTSEQIDLIAVALMPSAPDPKNMVDVFTYGVPLGTRTFVASKLSSLFSGPLERVEHDRIVRANITSQVPLFGGPCNRWDGDCPGNALRLDLNSNASMSPSANTPRAGYQLRACEELTARDSAVKNLLQKVGLSETSVATDASLRRAYAAFFPGRSPSAASMSSMMAVFDGARVLSNLPLDGWRMLFYGLCEAPGFDAP